MDIKISEIINMQKELIEKHNWNSDLSEGRNSILYMVEEIGETIAILKKKGETAVMENTIVRQAFLEEMSDVLMYYSKILLCYSITAEEISAAFVNKYEIATQRDFDAKYEKFLCDK